MRKLYGDRNASNVSNVVIRRNNSNEQQCVEGVNNI